jgi:hypothetical protein
VFGRRELHVRLVWVHFSRVPKRNQCDDPLFIGPFLYSDPHGIGGCTKSKTCVVPPRVTETLALNCPFAVSLVIVGVVGLRVLRAVAKPMSLS